MFKIWFNPGQKDQAEHRGCCWRWLTHYLHASLGAGNVGCWMEEGLIVINSSYWNFLKILVSLSPPCSPLINKVSCNWPVVPAGAGSWLSLSLSGTILTLGFFGSSYHEIFADQSLGLTFLPSWHCVTPLSFRPQLSSLLQARPSGRPLNSSHSHYTPQTITLLLSWCHHSCLSFAFLCASSQITPVFLTRLWSSWELSPSLLAC